MAVYRLRGGGGGLWGSGYGLRTLSTVAEVFHNEVRISHTFFTKNYTGDFEIAPSNTPFECILSYHPCVRVLGYRIMFPST